MQTDLFDTLSDLYSHCGEDWRAAAGGAGALVALWLARGCWRGLRRLLAPRPPGALAQGLLDFLSRDDVAWNCEQMINGEGQLHGGPAIYFHYGAKLYRVIVSGRDLLAQLSAREQRLVRAAVEARAGKVLARERERVAHAALCALAGVPRAAGLPAQPVSTPTNTEGQPRAERRYA